MALLYLQSIVRQFVMDGVQLFGVLTYQHFCSKFLNMHISSKSVRCVTPAEFLQDLWRLSSSKQQLRFSSQQKIDKIVTDEK